MLNHGPPDTDQHEQEVRLRQFFAWLIPIVLGFVPLLGIAFVAFGLISLAIAGALLLSYGILLLYVRARLTPNRLDAAVAAICSGLFVLVLLLKLTEPLSPATLAVMPLLAVVIALPYVERRVLRRLLFVAWLMALIVALLNEIAAPVAGLPLWVSVAFRAGSFAVVVGLLLLLLWQFSRRLGETLERTQATNAALRTSEGRFRTLVDSMDDIVFTLDREQRHTGVFGRWLEKRSLRPETFLGKTASEVLGDENAPIHIQANQRALMGESVVYEWTSYLPDGPRYFQTSLSPLHDSNGSIIGVVGIGREITELKHAEEALRQAEIRYRTLVEQIPAITYISEPNPPGTFVYVSPQIEQLLGFTPEEWMADPQSWQKQIHPEDRERVTAVNEHSIATGEPFDLEYRMLTRDGRTVWFHDRSVWFRDDAGRPNLNQGVSFDITERKRAEEAHQLFERQKLESQKLESLAVLAGGIAHDFNNILAIILGNVDLARTELPPDSSVHELLAPVVGAVQRASSLTQQMLAYSGKGHFLLEQIDLNLLLRQLRDPIRAALGAHAQVIYYLAPELPPITADPSQIRQAVLNLVINAAEAIGDATGAMTIRTDARLFERTDLADSYLAPDLAAGRYVVLEVADSGAGMDEATLARIFEPFFTTKFMGRGLGLAAVLGIVRGHRGAIRVRSAPGQGSAFTILLPAADK